MDEKKKKRMLDDDALDQVVGGATMRVYNPNNNYINCRSGAGSNYSKEYSLKNGSSVYTVDKVYNDEDGYYWSQLDDGNWVPSDLLRK